MTARHRHRQRKDANADDRIVYQLATRNETTYDFLRRLSSDSLRKVKAILDKDNDRLGRWMRRTSEVDRLALAAWLWKRQDSTRKTLKHILLAHDVGDGEFIRQEEERSPFDQDRSAAAVIAHLSADTLKKVKVRLLREMMPHHPIQGKTLTEEERQLFANNNLYLWLVNSQLFAKGLVVSSIANYVREDGLLDFDEALVIKD